jgi:hypothetical protein
MRLELLVENCPESLYVPEWPTGVTSIAGATTMGGSMAGGGPLQGNVSLGFDSRAATAMRTAYMLVTAAEIGETGTFMMYGGGLLLAAGGPVAIGAGVFVVLVGGGLNVVAVGTVAEAISPGSVTGRFGH